MISDDIKQFFLIMILGLENETITDKELENIIFPNKNYKIVKVLGRGSNGIVFDVRSIYSRKHFAAKVVRIIIDENNTLDEFNFQNHLAEYKMAPKVYDTQVIDCFFKNKKVRFVLGIMEIIYCTINEYIDFGGNPNDLLDPLECLIRKKIILQFDTNKRIKNHLLHGDMHIGNIIILSDRKTLGFLDFGISKLKPMIFQILDAIPLISSFKYDNDRNYDNKAIANSIINIYEKLFNIKLDYNKFQNHPSGGYMYVTSRDNFLHSYDWEENIAMLRFRLPNANEIRRSFPNLRLPKLV